MGGDRVSVQEVIARCRDLGVTLAPGPGGKLRATPPGRLPEELREELRRYKAEVLALLTAEKAEARSWPCSACGKPARIEEVDAQGRTFWTCSGCRASGVTPREPGKPYTPQDNPSALQDKPSPLKELYRHAMAEIGDDYLPVIEWLVERHPERWKEIRKADDCLSEMERQGVSEQEYQQALDRFLTLLRGAKALYEQAHKQWGKEGRTLAVHPCGGTRFWLSRFSDLWICEKCTPPPERGAVKRWVEAGEEITEGVCFVQ
jgi:hypothetical protein